MGFPVPGSEIRKGQQIQSSVLPQQTDDRTLDSDV